MSSFARIVSPLHDQPPAEVVARLVPGARTAAEPASGAWRSVRTSHGALDVTLRDTSLTDGHRLLDRIRAMQADIVALMPNGPTAQAFRLHRLVGRARHIVEVEGFRIDDRQHQSFVFDYARLVFGAVQFPRGFVDSNARWLIDAKGISAPDAALREVPEARERRSRSIALLARSNVRIPEQVPMLIESEREALTCSAFDARRRALALHRTFRETCGAPDLAIERDADVRALVEEELSPKERAAMMARDRNYAGGCVESAWAVLFAVGAIADMGPLGAPCDARRMVDRLDDATGHGSLDGGTLRPLSEILDVADVHHCIAWSAADTQSALPSSMNRAVIQLRLRALRWVLMDQFAEWDDVTMGA